ncbi:MAG: hypothetical protein RLZZ338_4242 [Cyanobacteriota bacterium]|jgi:hypothetical protein
MVGNNAWIAQVKGASQGPKKTVVGASRSLQDLPRERDVRCSAQATPTHYLFTKMGCSRQRLTLQGIDESH